MSSQGEHICNECYRRYTDFAKYQTHVKLKHRESRHSRSALNEEEVWEVEEKIYAYLGELSELYAENVRPSEPEDLLEGQRFIGQANYLPNAVVRTPYENEIDILDELPRNYRFHPLIEVSLTDDQISKISEEVNDEIRVLCGRLKQERNYWEFADPNDEKMNFDDQFSVLDVAKLVKNYPRRNINLHMPELAIFLVWIGRILKSDMFKLVYELLVSYVIIYEDYLKREKIPRSGRKQLKYWAKYVDSQKKGLADKGLYDSLQLSQGENSLRGFSLHLNEKNINIKKLEKLVELYEGWVEVVLPILGGDRKGQEDSKESRIKN